VKPIPKERFDGLIERALAAIPEDIRALLVNVSIESRLRPGPERGNLPARLLGMYSGPTRETMAGPYGGGLPPGRIVLYRRNLESVSEDEGALLVQISRTLRHEIAHHLGIGHERLRRVWPEGV
jgi:predicted Zn-dependent protease with MMP-like domain